MKGERPADLQVSTMTAHDVTAALSATILGFVRRCAECILLDEPPPAAATEIDAFAYDGAFVTLKTGGELRGCMGTFAPRRPLSVDLVETTRSALHDPRFAHDRITPDVLPSICMEVSILSHMHTVTDPLSLVAGKHGIIIVSPCGSGCFLPQVATEYGWDMPTFLGACCTHKAHLPPDAWREPGTVIRAFEATIFSEKHPPERV